MASVEFTQRCLDEDFAALPDKTAHSILQKLEILEASPDFGKALTGELAGYRRLAFGHFRIVYRHHKQSRTVFVVLLGIRKGTEADDVYALAHRLIRAGRLEPTEEQVRTARQLNDLLVQVKAKVEARAEDARRKRETKK